MKRFTVRPAAHFALAGLASLGVTMSANAQNVGVSVNVNTPGIYGQITIGGGLPTPELLMPRAVVAVPTAVAVAEPPEPLYLHVPPGHEKHWARHCREYNACGRPVYFVSDHWYHEVYEPRRHEHEHEHERHEYDRDHDHDHGHGHDRDHDHGHDRDDR